MRVPGFLLAGDAPITDRVTVAVWHEVDQRVDGETTTLTFHTTPIEVDRPTEGTVDVDVTCLECRRPVSLRIVDLATARRRRIGSMLGPAMVLLALPLWFGGIAGLGALDLPGGTLTVVSTVLSVIWIMCKLADRAGCDPDGVTILPSDDWRHRLGSGSASVTTLEERPYSSM